MCLFLDTSTMLEQEGSRRLFRVMDYVLVLLTLIVLGFGESGRLTL